MKKTNKPPVFLTTAALLLCLVTFQNKASSQSLPKIQEVSMRAPANIKIDGRTLEWPNNRLNAFNYTNNMSYAVTNDDENLYLTVRGTYFYASAKLMRGGLTFTISRTTDKRAREKAKDNVAVTFPVLAPKDAESIVSSINDYQPMAHDTVNQKRAHDSLAMVVNAKTANAIKYIKVMGIKAIEDTLISIYNSTGVKAMGTFNRGMAFTVEMAIPLKYLGLSVNDGTRFSYNIRFNAPAAVKRQDVVQIQAGASGPAITIMPLDNVPVNADWGYLMNATDFWGEYTLAKK